MRARGAVTAKSLRQSTSSEATGGVAMEERPFRIPKTAELVADHIRKMIIRGELRPGDYLESEAVLIKRFSAARATIREAVLILEAEQFLTVTRGSRNGAQVHLPEASSPAKYAGFFLQSQGTTIADIYQVRAAIEPYAVWLLAKRQSQDDVDVLSAELEVAAGFQEKGEIAAFRTSLVRFHRKIVDLTESNSLRLTISMFNDLIERHQLGLARSAARTMNDCVALKSFWRLLNLIKRGEAEKAQAHWRLHIQTTMDFWFASNDENMTIDLLDR